MTAAARYLLLGDLERARGGGDSESLRRLSFDSRSDLRGGDHEDPRREGCGRPLTASAPPAAEPYCDGGPCRWYLSVLAIVHCRLHMNIKWRRP